MRHIGLTLYNIQVCNLAFEILSLLASIYTNSANLQSQSPSTYINIICANPPAPTVPGINTLYKFRWRRSYLPITNDRPNQWNARRQCRKEHPVRSCNTTKLNSRTNKLTTFYTHVSLTQFPKKCHICIVNGYSAHVAEMLKIVISSL